MISFGGAPSTVVKERVRGRNVIIPDGWFRGKNAELKSTADGDWVLIEGETEFRYKDGTIATLPEGYDERDLRYVYDLLRKREHKA